MAHGRPGPDPHVDQYLAMAAPAPCDDCRHAAKCRAEKLLCEAFNLYVSGEGRPRWSLAPRVPTRALYLALLDREQRPSGRAKKARAARMLRRRRAHRGAPILGI